MSYDRKMRIAAVVVTYHPDKSLLTENIKAFIDYVDKVIIWQNSEDSLDYLSKWKDKIILLGNGKNVFIAKALNSAISYSLENGYDFLLTMDQDSRWIDFKGFIDAVEKTSNNENVAIYAPNVNGYLTDSSIEYKDIEWVIQSGMLINLHIINGLGGFREDYQIYGVDEEFCYWIRINGKKTRSYTNYHLAQRYGEAKKSRFGFTVYNYSPLVRYFLIRNMIWMKREFPQSTITRRILHVIFDNYRDILLVENDKFAKLKGFTCGIYDGLIKRIPSPRRRTLR